MRHWRLQFSLSILVLLGLFFLNCTIYVVFDICIKKESIVLIFRRDIRYFHHGQRCDDMMMKDSPAACNYEYHYTKAYSINKKAFFS